MEIICITIFNWHILQRTLPHFFITLLLLLLFFHPNNLQSQSKIVSKKGFFKKLQEKALQHAKKGEFKKSIKYLKKLYKLQSYNEKIIWYYALALLHQESISPLKYRRDAISAARLLKKSILMQKRVDLRSRELGLRYFYLAMALWYSDNSIGALNAFKNSYRVDFERYDAVYNQFSILEQLGRSNEARIMRLKYMKLLKARDVDD